MKHFISSGVFWLPADRTREVPGQVTFDADGVTLTLQGSLRAPAVLPGAGGPASPEWASEPVAHGRLHGGTEVTLLDLDGLTMPFRLHEETWRAGFALSGGLTEADAFDVARFEFDALHAWADPPGIAAEGPPSERVVIDPRSATVAETELADQTRLCCEPASPARGVTIASTLTSGVHSRRPASRCRCAASSASGSGRSRTC